MECDQCGFASLERWGLVVIVVWDVKWYYVASRGQQMCMCISKHSALVRLRVIALR
jgi:hypothetical protein